MSKASRSKEDNVINHGATVQDLVVFRMSTIKFLRRWQSGQLQRTVNPSDLSYAGSNPARRTMKINISILLVFIFILVSPGFEVYARER